MFSLFKVGRPSGPSMRTRIAEHRDWTRATNRVASLPTPELLQWWETSLYACQRARESYERQPDPAALSEALRDTATVLAAIYELQNRSTPS